MLSLEEVRPKHKNRIIDLAREAGLDVTGWGNFKGGQARAASNPRHCYEWSFTQGELIILNLWFKNMKLKDGKIFQPLNFKKRATEEAQHDAEQVWRSRASKTDDAIQIAYQQGLLLRLIILDGKRGGGKEKEGASRVSKRMLDPVAWAVTEYNPETGDCILVRGIKPVSPKEYIREETHAPEGFEGEMKRRFVWHRGRERGVRELKIRDALRRNNGALLCEVPNCGFDFFKVYGSVGQGYAEVHHKVPLSEAPAEVRKVMLDDLAVVCANCHAMVHRGGECRELESLITLARRKRK